MLSHNQYIDKKVASALIHHSVANFGKSLYPQHIPDEKVVYFRMGLLLFAAIAFLFQFLGTSQSLMLSLLMDLEFYTTTSAIVALVLSHQASKIKNAKEPNSNEIRTKRKAIIWNSLAITINTVVVLIYFFFIPIVLASDGLMTVSYFFNFKTLAFLFSYGAILAHFLVIEFIMLEKDYKWIIITLSLWAMFNLTTEVDGLFFREMKGAKNIIKISLAGFFIVSSTSLYFVLTAVSQWVKKVSERQEIRKILK